MLERRKMQKRRKETPPYRTATAQAVSCGSSWGRDNRTLALCYWLRKTCFLRPLSSFVTDHFPAPTTVLGGTGTAKQLVSQTDGLR
jgi:hypothetical protein